MMKAGEGTSYHGQCQPKRIEMLLAARPHYFCRSNSSTKQPNDRRTKPGKIVRRSVHGGRHAARYLVAECDCDDEIFT